MQIRSLLLSIKYIKSFKGLSFKSMLNLYISALYNLVRDIITGNRMNPVTVLGGLYLIKPHNIYIYSRKMSDDLYNCLPNRERDVEKFILNNLEKGDIFIDVGANIGYYSLLASRIVGLEGKVISIEPVPETFKTLLVNLALNNAYNVHAIQAAAWDTDGYVQIFVPKMFYGISSVYKSNTNSRKILVKTITLDKILRKYNKVKIVKIDVEGSELNVLRGMKENLTKIQYLVIELSRNKHKVIDILIRSDFIIRKFKFTNYILALNKKYL